MAAGFTQLVIKDGNGNLQNLEVYADASGNLYPAPVGTDALGDILGLPANPISVFAPVPTLTTSSAYAHTASVSAYAYGQLWANNATAGSVTFGTVSPAKAVNQAFAIIGGSLKKSGIVTTNAIFRVHLFNAAPTTAVADYGTFTGNVTWANWIGSLDGSMGGEGGSDVCQCNLVPTFGSAIYGTPVSGAQTLYFVIEVRAAYTPVSAETLTLTLAVQ